MSIHNKYIKYKTKYQNLKKMNNDQIPVHNKNSFIISNECEFNPNESSVPNCNIECLNNFQCITGPVSYYCFKNRNTTVHIFGDRHHCASDNFVCQGNQTYISDFLFNLFEQEKSKQFDFFVELPYSKRKNRQIGGDNALTNIENRFRMCLPSQPRYYDNIKCKNTFSNVRFHAADIRRFYMRHPSIKRSMFMETKSEEDETEIITMINTLVRKNKDSVTFDDIVHLQILTELLFGHIINIKKYSTDKKQILLILILDIACFLSGIDIEYYMDKLKKLPTEKLFEKKYFREEASKITYEHYNNLMNRYPDQKDTFSLGTHKFNNKSTNIDFINANERLKEYFIQAIIQVGDIYEIHKNCLLLLVLLTKFDESLFNGNILNIYSRQFSIDDILINISYYILDFYVTIFNFYVLHRTLKVIYLYESISADNNKNIIMYFGSNHSEDIAKYFMDNTNLSLMIVNGPSTDVPNILSVKYNKKLSTNDIRRIMIAYRNIKNRLSFGYLDLNQWVNGWDIYLNQEYQMIPLNERTDALNFYFDKNVFMQYYINSINKGNERIINDNERFLKIDSAEILKNII